MLKNKRNEPANDIIDENVEIETTAQVTEGEQESGWRSRRTCTRGNKNTRATGHRIC